MPKIKWKYRIEYCVETWHMWKEMNSRDKAQEAINNRQNNQALCRIVPVRVRPKKVKNGD